VRDRIERVRGGLEGEMVNGWHPSLSLVVAGDSDLPADPKSGGQQ
jgi:hypothetical protein